MSRWRWKIKVKIERFWHSFGCSLIDGKICGRTRMKKKFQWLTSTFSFTQLTTQFTFWMPQNLPNAKRTNAKLLLNVLKSWTFGVDLSCVSYTNFFYWVKFRVIKRFRNRSWRHFHPLQLFGYLHSTPRRATLSLYHQWYSCFTQREARTTAEKLQMIKFLFHWTKISSKLFAHNSKKKTRSSVKL